MEIYTSSLGEPEQPRLHMALPIACCTYPIRELSAMLSRANSALFPHQSALPLPFYAWIPPTSLLQCGVFLDPPSPAFPQQDSILYYVNTLEKVSQYLFSRTVSDQLWQSSSHMNLSLSATRLWQSKDATHDSSWILLYLYFCTCRVPWSIIMCNERANPENVQMLEGDFSSSVSSTLISDLPPTILEPQDGLTPRA
jgi:hypothetical protein